MKQYYITFENLDEKTILDYHCADEAEQQTLINAWNRGESQKEFPVNAEYAFAWSYEPIAYTQADTTRRSIITGRYKPGGVDY